MAEEIKADGESSWWQGDLLKSSPSGSMNKDEENDTDDLASEVETDWTRKEEKTAGEGTTAISYEKYRPSHLTFLSNL